MSATVGSTCCGSRVDENTVDLCNFPLAQTRGASEPAHGAAQCRQYRTCSCCCGEACGRPATAFTAAASACGRWGASQKKARRADLARARKRPKVIPQHLLAPRVSLSPTYYVNVLPHVMNGRTIHTVATVQHDRFI